MKAQPNGQIMATEGSRRKGLFQAVLFLLITSLFLLGPARASGGGIGSVAGPLTGAWGQRDWGKAFGGEDNEEAFAIAYTSDGGCILAGRTYTFDGGSGYGDAWILKLGPDGNVGWEKRYGDLLWDEIDSIQQTADGGYIAAGYRYPPGESQEAWVMKLTPDGEVDWQYTYGRADHYDGAVAIRPTADGGFILLGWTQAYAIGGEQGAWILKLTANGGVEWQKFLGGSEFDFLFSVEQTTDGGYVLAGGTYTYTDFPYYSEVWLVKMFSNGDVDWEKTYGGPSSDVAYSVKQTSDGGYVLGCWTALSRGDAWVLKTDPVGNLEWQQRYGGEWADVPTSLIQASDGGFVIGGYTSSFGSGSSDGWVFKLAANGRVEWQKTFGGSGPDAFNDIVETTTGYAAAGSTSSFGAGNEDVWVIHFTPVGPGTLLMKTVAGPSHARSPAMEDVVEKYLTEDISDTQVSPVTSAATASETAATETSLSRFPGKGKPFSTGVLADSASESGFLPIYPKTHRWK